MPHVFKARGVKTHVPEERARMTLHLPDRVFRARDGFEVFVPSALVERLVQFARRDAPNEWGGLLAVQRFRDDHGPYARVEGVLPFDGARATPSRLATTLESELRARELLRGLYPDAVPGGWVHSHPGHGLFFSSTDRTTQRTWTDANAIALVVDPSSPELIAAFRGPQSERIEEVGVTVSSPPQMSTTKKGLCDEGFARGEEPAEIVAEAARDAVAAASPRSLVCAVNTCILLAGVCALVGGLALTWWSYVHTSAALRALDDHVGRMDAAACLAARTAPPAPAVRR